MEKFNTKIVSGAKIIILALALAVGVSYVGAWVGPSASAPEGNVPAPVHVGITDQVKTIGSCANADCGGIAVGIFNAAKAASFNDKVYLGSPSLSEFQGTGQDLYLRKWSEVANNNIDPLCVERSTGIVMPCPTGGSSSVSLTVDQPTIATSETSTISQGVTLTWTTQNLVNATCTSTQNNGATGFTSTPSYAGGSDSATVEKFGTTTFTISCTPDGGGSPVTDSVTVIATGYRTFSSSGTSFTASGSEFPSSFSLTFKAVGGGGGGVTTFATCNDPYCENTGGNGGGTIIDYTGGTTFDFTATGGTGAYSCTEGVTQPNCPASSSHGSGGTGNSTNGATVYSGSVITSGGNSIGLGSYGGGGNASGRDGGGGAGILATKTVSSGSTFAVTIGLGGAAGDFGGGVAGGNGVVRFEW